MERVKRYRVECYLRQSLVGADHWNVTLSLVGKSNVQKSINYDWLVELR